MADPQADGLAVRVVSAALAAGDLQVQFAFPRGHDAAVKNPPLDWSQPNSHWTVISDRAAGAARLVRRRDDLRYEVLVDWSPGAVFAPGGFGASLPPRAGRGRRGTALRALVRAGPGPQPASLGGGARPRGRPLAGLLAQRRSGGFFREHRSARRGARAPRRPLPIPHRDPVRRPRTAVRDRPHRQLVDGKHNTEMVWWHVGALRPLGSAGRHRPGAGLVPPHAGAGPRHRGWPGSAGRPLVQDGRPDGRESPGGNPLIVWNQPHPIYLAELLYRAQPDRQTLAAWSELVFATADCLAAMLGAIRDRALPPRAAAMDRAGDL